MTTRAIVLVDRNGLTVPATLHPALSEGEMQVLHEQWEPERDRIRTELREAGVPAASWPDNLDWNWARRAQLLASGVTRCVGIEAEEQWQAAMLVSLVPSGARAPERAGRPVLYVQYLESAPWNQSLPELGRSGKLRLAGSVLLRYAAELSSTLGGEGWFGLHSLARSEPFYRRQRTFRYDFGPDPAVANLAYFEFASLDTIPPGNSGDL